MAQTSSHRLGDTFDFLAQIYERNSSADAGMSLDATVHFGQDYNDAFWNSVQTVFGNGDRELFGRRPPSSKRSVRAGRMR